MTRRPLLLAALALALGTFVGARLALWLVLWREPEPLVRDWVTGRRLPWREWLALQDSRAVPRWREPYADDDPDPDYAVTGI